MMNKVGRVEMKQFRKKDQLTKKLQRLGLASREDKSKEQEVAPIGEEEEEQIPPELVEYDFINRQSALGQHKIHKRRREFLLDYLKGQDDVRDKRTEIALQEGKSILDS